MGKRLSQRGQRRDPWLRDRAHFSASAPHRVPTVLARQGTAPHADSIAVPGLVLLFSSYFL